MLIIIEETPISKNRYINLHWSKRAKYKNKKWLYNKYINEKLSTREITKICEAKSKTTILSWLKRLNIYIRPPSKAWEDKHRSEETKQKLSKATKGKMPKNIPDNTGRIHSEETKLKIGKAHKGMKHSKETKQKISDFEKGKMPKNLQVAGIWGHIERGYFNINGREIFFRSKWEANYSLYLDFLIKQKQIKKWTYEEDVFIFEKIKYGTRSYRPDFKIYNFDKTIIYHEVKGYMDSKSKTKIKRMAKYYPKVKLLIIDKDVYNDIKNKLGKMLKFY